MKQRIITALVLVAFIFGGLFVASDYVFGVAVFGIAMLGASEWIKLAEVGEENYTKYLAIFGVVTLVVAMLFKYVLFIFPIFWCFAAYQLYKYEQNRLETLSQNNILLYGLFALAPFSASLYVIHHTDIAWVFLFILVVAAADSGAYFVGKSIGKVKMLPRLSPNKTIEGLLGGFICSVTIALIFLLFMDVSFIDYIIMSFVCGIVAVVSVMGDVFESMIKRIAGVKESGNVLPGHGGVLDRIDGYLPALPLFVLLGYLFGIFTF